MSDLYIYIYIYYIVSILDQNVGLSVAFRMIISTRNYFCIENLIVKVLLVGHSV